MECGKQLHSVHVHDFQSCGCDNHTFTDGGNDYQRIGGKDMNKVATLRADGKFRSVTTDEEA